MMELTVLGSGTVSPSPTRTAPAHWVAAGDVRLLLDCGAGMLHSSARAGVNWFGVTHVAITHFHVDHLGELPALIMALRWGARERRTAPLRILGPTGISTRLGHLADAFGKWVVDPEFQLDIVELEPGSDTLLAEDVSLSCCHTEHTEESLAYSVSMGGHRLVYTGDTGPSERLARWARGCDLMLCECSLPEDLAVAIHLTPAQAGRMAALAEARRLVLTHFYPPLEGTSPESLAAGQFEGDVVAASDGQSFTVGA